ncbi:hypothetical protein BHM03_00020513 [Ensete ventricosum]|nr:hypothetical protein BHM03_00020513 [Ensete ventricosum]
MDSGNRLRWVHVRLEGCLKYNVVGGSKFGRIWWFTRRRTTKAKMKKDEIGNHTLMLTLELRSHRGQHIALSQSGIVYILHMASDLILICPFLYCEQYRIKDICDFLRCKNNSQVVEPIYIVWTSEVVGIKYVM